MELGEKIRACRLELGLSQRQLCGDMITRNMLSQIENGGARPSLDTLGALAQRLGKPISFFLEEDAITSPNAQVLEKARQAYRRGDFAACTQELEAYRAPDPMFDWESGLLLALAWMALARQAREAGKEPYAQTLLERAGEAGAQTPYFTPAMERERLLLARQGERIPPDDRELCQRAEAALTAGAPQRAGEYLDAAQNRTDARWCLLRGRAYLAQGQYEDARVCLEQAREAYPQACAAGLEVCFRELGDFRQAYYYACLQRQG